MGMMSYFDDEDLKVTDWEGLLNFIEMWKKEFPDGFIDKKDMINIEEKTITFKNWDDIKLISYWYKEDIVFLKCIAQYIEGNVYWNFENNDEAGFVEFENGECIFNLGVMKWGEYKSGELLRERSFGRNDEFDKKLEKMMLAHSLK
jgi:hypothetical protein